jgi:hypothetical protein
VSRQSVTTDSPCGRDLWVRLSTVIGIALLAGLSLAVVSAVGQPFLFGDQNGYWDAALRLRTGQGLYAEPAFLSGSYQYPPWFALVWLPLTFLPQLFVQVCWTLLLLAAAVWLLLRAHPLLAAALAPFLIWACFIGNVQTLMLAGLAYGLPRRSGPVWIGVAASLKITPIVYALVYVGRRQWREALVAGVVAAILWLPGLAFGIADYPTTIGGTLSVLSRFGLLVYIPAVLIACAFVLWRPSWLSASVAVLTALPRLLLYDLGYLLVPAREPAKTRQRQVVLFKAGRG